MEKRTKSFVSGAAILGVAGILVKIIGAAFRIPLANAVGSVGMSYYEVAYPYYAWLLVISSSGLPTAISKRVSEKITLGDYRGANELLSAALKLLFIIGVATSLLMFFGADALAALSSFEGASLSFKALAPALFLVSIMCAYRGYLQGLQLMTGTAISQIIEQLVKLGAGLLLAISFLEKGPEYAAMGALIGVTISEFVALIAIYVYYRSKKKQIDRLAARSTSKPIGFSKMAKSLLSIALPITIGASISPLTGIVDSAFIGRILQDNLGFAQEHAQTAYSLLRTNVTTLTNMPGVITVALAMSLVPAISACIVRKDRAGVRMNSRMGLKLALIIGAPCAAGLFVLGEPVLQMLYPRLNPAELALATELMRTSSIGIIFLSLVQTMTGVIQGLGKPNVPVFNLFIGFVLKVITMLILMNIPKINIQGAAVSTVVCYAYAGIMNTVFTMRYTRMPVKGFDTFAKPLISSLVMGVVVYFIYSSLGGMEHSTLATLASVAAGVAIYAILFVVLKMVSYEELALIPGGNKLRKIMYPKGNAAR